METARRWCRRILRDFEVTWAGCVDALTDGLAVFARKAVLEDVEMEVERIVLGRVMQTAWRWPACAELQVLPLHSFGVHAALAMWASCAIERVAGLLPLWIVAGDFNIGGTTWLLGPGGGALPAVGMAPGAEAGGGVGGALC